MTIASTPPATTRSTSLAVPDVPQDELVVFRRREVGQVFEVPGVGQLVQVDDLVSPPVFRAKEATDEIGPDKPGPAGDEDLHILPF